MNFKQTLGIGCVFFFSFCTCACADHQTTLKEIFTEENTLPLNSHCKPHVNTLNHLQQICKILQVKHVVDAGCGDARWLQPLISTVNYVGVDIVDTLIANNRIYLDSSHAHFLSLDITKETLPKADLLLCRDCLDYFSYFDIFTTLEKLKASGCEYLCATTYPHLDDNTETATGIKRQINLEAYPFLFLGPCMRFAEAVDNERYLAVWKLQDIDLSTLYSFVFPPLTVLSKPVGGPQGWEHPAVVNSARRGLAKIHRNFNINPDNIKDVKENVLVLANIEAALQAYQWKQEQRINTLLVGPNVAASSTEFDAFLTWPLIDAYLANCEWVRDNFFRFSPAMRRHTRLWFSGVDEAYWKPSLPFKQKTSNQVLLYRKTNGDVCDQAQICLENHGYQVISLTYGNHSQVQYKESLEKCRFAVFISCSESQGIALAEAWSMDVPTLVWNPKEPITYIDHVYENVSSSPYLNPSVGKDWVKMDELEELLVHFTEISKDFQPRRWLLLHMTDKISIEQLLFQIRAVSQAGP
jgi:hypothetical protein